MVVRNSILFLDGLGVRSSLKATRGHTAGQLPVRGCYRGPAALPVTSSHVVPGTNCRSTLDCFANGIEIEFQNPGALS